MWDSLAEHCLVCNDDVRHASGLQSVVCVLDADWAGDRLGCLRCTDRDCTNTRDWTIPVLLDLPSHVQVVRDQALPLGESHAAACGGYHAVDGPQSSVLADESHKFLRLCGVHRNHPSERAVPLSHAHEAGLVQCESFMLVFVGLG